jgi:hypothetical protein
MLNTGHLLLTNWEQLTPAQRAQMGLSMAFWGVSSAASTRMAGARTPSDFVNMTFNPAAMRQQLLDTYRPPVVRDSQMPGNAVRIDYTEANGLVTGVRIRAGESARQADIDLHTRVAQSMMQHSGLEGRLRNLMSRNGEAPVGSRAWEALFEIEKLGRVINANRAQLDNPALSPAERSQVEADILAYEQELAQHRATVEGFESNWAHGTGFIDANSAGRIRAQELGLPERPVSAAAARQLGLTEEQAASYHWYLPPGHDSPIIRSRLENQPHLAWDDSAQAVARVAGDPVRPTYVNDQPTILNLSAGDRRAYESTLRARDQAMAARDRLLDLKERQQVVLTARQDAELRRLQGTVSEQSRIVGEIGARQYVEQTYPNARLVYGGPNAGSQAGDFDQIWRVPGTNGTGDRFILVEAKGGSATLGTRRIGTQVETQGTTAYYNEIMSIMSRSQDPNVRRLMDEVRGAHDRGGVSYLEIKTPIHGGAVDDVRVREFRIAA